MVMEGVFPPHSLGGEREIGGNTPETFRQFITNASVIPMRKKVAAVVVERQKDLDQIHGNALHGSAAAEHQNRFSREQVRG